MDKVRDRLIEYFAVGYDPCGQDEVEADAILPLVKTLMADAWDQGFDAGERDVFEHEHHGDWDSECIRNPYRD